ncbi:MAG: AmmeMemoRadiSam system protein B [Planctomycetota bacterium]
MQTPPPLRPLGVSGPLPGDRVAVYDPLGVSEPAREGAFLLDVEEWTWAQGFDGRADVGALAERIGRGARGEVRPERIADLAERLSRAHLLEDDRFERAFAREFDGFRRDTVRNPLGAGTEYPSDPFDLRIRIGGVVADDWDMPPLEDPVGVWAPGGPLPAAAALYGRAYAAIRHARRDVRRVVVMGSAGGPLDPLLVPLAKPFETPLGTVEVDREALAQLGVLPGREQLAHRFASVLERQLLFVRLLFPTVPIVPILVGSFDAEREPAGDPEVVEALAALERVRALEGRTLVVAASDLYHLRRPHALTAAAPPGAMLGGARGNEIAAGDRAELDAFESLDPDAFARASLLDGDPGRASQASAPYLLLAHAVGSCPGLRATNLGYLQCPAPGALFTAGASVLYRDETIDG